MKKEIWILIDSKMVGGIESHVLLLAQTLNNKGLNVRVVFIKNHGNHPLKDMLKLRNIPVMEENPHLYRSIREHRPVLLHTHGYKAGIVGRLVGLFTHTPVVSTYHNGDCGTGRMRVYATADRLLGFLSRNIVVSQEIADRLCWKNQLIDNFVNIPEADECGGEGSIIAFVGRLNHEKGPDYFCELSELLPEYEFHIYGDGVMRAELEACYDESIKFFGMVDDIDKRWKGIALLCMPSREEGLPLAALEAMAHKVPVAAFSVGGLPELIVNGENGYLAKCGDVTGLAALMSQHMQLADRQEINSAARKTITEQYTSDVCVDEIIAIYRSEVKEEL